MRGVMETDNQTSKLRILILAPQPFFQHRGTPIATRLLAVELAHMGHDVHLLVYHEGEDVEMPGVTVHRTARLPFVKNIRPSFSWKKIACDIAMFFKAMKLVRQNSFDVVHAVEEAAFIAQVLNKVYRVPYIYDMDSSLPIQLVDKLQVLLPAKKMLQMCERSVIRSSIGVVAVCKELEKIAIDHAPEKNVATLEDISLLEDAMEGEENLREKYGIEGPLMLYVGNLEGYQGIDLLLDGFQYALQRGCKGNVVIIGGTEESIELYREKAAGLGISDNTFFCGARPVELLGHYLKQADILLSPRVQGNNTPMKLYSYLDSGKVVLATDLPTHTQVLDHEVSYLVFPDKEAMATGMEHLLSDHTLRDKLGAAGRRVARARYSLAAFRRKLQKFYFEIRAVVGTLVAIVGDFADIFYL